MLKTHAHQDVATLPLFLSTAEVAALLGVSPGTLRQWRHQKRGPAYVVLNGGPVRYERATLLSYLAARTIKAQPSVCSAGSGSNESASGPSIRSEDAAASDPAELPARGR